MTEWEYSDGVYRMTFDGWCVSIIRRRDKYQDNWVLRCYDLNIIDVPLCSLSKTPYEAKKLALNTVTKRLKGMLKNVVCHRLGHSGSDGPFCKDKDCDKWKVRFKSKQCIGCKIK